MPCIPIHLEFEFKKYEEVKVPGCMPKLQGCYYESRFKAKLKAKKNKLSHLLQNLVTTLQHNSDQFLVRNCNSFQPIKLQWLPWSQILLPRFSYTCYCRVVERDSLQNLSLTLLIFILKTWVCFSIYISTRKISLLISRLELI